MSRVGKAPINIPNGVEVLVEQSSINVKGKLGALNFSLPKEVKVEKNAHNVLISLVSSEIKSRAMWGLTRSLVNNMVKGVSEGFERKLEIIGVGYKADVNAGFLTLNLGYSHEIKFLIPEGIIIKAEKPTLISVFGCDKQMVGQVASLIRKQRPPEPYKGKGIRFLGENVSRKEGKKK